MKRLNYILFFILSGCLFTVQADQLTVRNNHSITEPTLKLSHFFDKLPAHLDEEILEAPPAGSERYFSAIWIKKLASNYKLNLAINPRRGITIKRRGYTLNSDTIKSQLEDYLQGQGIIMSHNEEISLDKSSLKIYLAFPPKEMSIQDITWRDNKHFKAKIQVEGALEPYNVEGQVIETILIPVLNKEIKKGVIITEKDIAWKKTHKKERISQGVLLNIDNIVGKVSQRSVLRKNHFIRETDIQRPLLIKRGEIVTLEYQTTNILITLKGKAQQAGGKDERIRVLNMDSKKVIEGQIINGHTVKVN